MTNRRTPYTIIKSRYLTEKSQVLDNLATSESNACLKRFKASKAVFLVDTKANKAEIKSAIEEIYAKDKIKVTAVNTINVKPKAKRVRGRKGKTAAFKKAIVTLAVGDKLEAEV